MEVIPVIQVFSFWCCPISDSCPPVCFRENDQEEKITNRVEIMGKFSVVPLVFWFFGFWFLWCVVSATRWSI